MRSTDSTLFARLVVALAHVFLIVTFIARTTCSAKTFSFLATELSPSDVPQPLVSLHWQLNANCCRKALDTFQGSWEEDLRASAFRYYVGPLRSVIDMEIYGF